MRKLLLFVIAAGVLWTWCGRPGGHARLPAEARRVIERRLEATPQSARVPLAGARSGDAFERYHAAADVIAADGTARWLDPLRVYDAAPALGMPADLRAGLNNPAVVRATALLHEGARSVGLGVARPLRVFELSSLARLVVGAARIRADDDPAAAVRDAIAVARMGQDLSRADLLGGRVGTDVEARALGLLTEVVPRLGREARRELAGDIDALIASTPSARDALLAESATLDRMILDADTTGRDVDLWKDRAPSLAALAALNGRLRERWLAARDDAAIPEACAAELRGERFCPAAAELAIARAQIALQLRGLAR